MWPQGENISVERATTDWLSLARSYEATELFSIFMKDGQHTIHKG
jgi:hypothetical protein